MRVLSTLLGLLILTTLVSCGQSSSGSGAGGTQQENRGTAPATPVRGMNQNETISADGSNINGIYAADLFPVNYNLHFKQVGTASLQRDADMFMAQVNLKYGPRDTRVKQAVYTGRRCPNLSDDLNKDAYIDINEAMLAMGDITIPLDGVLDSQMEGSDQYPTGDSVTGRYSYATVGSFARFFADLKAPDENPYDNIIKLGAEDGLTFPGRVVMLLGVPESLALPPTVAGIEGQSVHSTIPLACGVLWKVGALPSF